MTPTDPYGDRPATPTDPRRVRGAGGIRIVLRRELATKLLTTAFLVSTLLFAAFSLGTPLLTSGGEDDAVRLGTTAATAEVARTVADASGGSVAVATVDGDPRAAVTDGDVDAALEVSRGQVSVVVDGGLDPALGAALQSATTQRALEEAAAVAGLDPAALAALAQAPRIVETGTATDMTGVLLALGFAAGAVVVVLLWGIPLATDVLQEKVSRVVEILLTTVRPWQLLAGKVLATTVLGLTQLVLVLGASVAGLALAGGLPRIEGVPWDVVALASVCLLLAIVTCCALMAGLAARVERQEDLSSALQPALGLALVPLAAAVYLAFEYADSPWLDIASLAPVFNVFVMPARVAVEGMPLWQVATSLAVAVATAVAAFLLAGRVYAGAVLRSGGRVTLADALRRG